MISAGLTNDCPECGSTDLEWYSGENYLCSECGHLSSFEDEEE